MHVRSVAAALALAFAVLLPTRAHADEPIDTVRRPTEKHWLRIAAGTLGLVVIGEAWYWRGGADTNADDRAFASAGSALAAKATGDGFRWDGDGFVTNGLKHPLFGLSSYALARENGLGVAGSLAFASLTSLAWETFGEIREYASYNDLLLTSPSGVPLGETLHLMLHERRGRTIDVRIGAGLHGEHAESTPFAVVAIGGSAGLLCERRGRWTAELPYDDAGQRGLAIGAHTEFPFASRGDGYLYLATAFDYRRRIERMNQDWDLHAVVQAGPGAAVELAAGDTSLIVSAEATLETGAESSRAFAGWRDLHPSAYVRSSEQLNPHGYYHAIGAGARMQVDAGYGPLHARVCAGVAVYRGVGGADQFEELVTARPVLIDVEQHGSGELAVSRGRFSLAGELSAWRFIGWAGAERAVATHHDMTLRLGAAF